MSKFRLQITWLLIKLMYLYQGRVIYNTCTWQQLWPGCVSVKVFCSSQKAIESELSVQTTDTVPVGWVWGCLHGVHASIDVYGCYSGRIIKPCRMRGVSRRPSRRHILDIWGKYKTIKYLVILIPTIQIVFKLIFSYIFIVILSMY